MPYHFEFDRQHRILLVMVTGVYSDDDQLSINSEIRKRAAALDVAAGIGDLSGITECTVTAAAVQVAAREPSPYAPNTPRFLVAPGDHVFGMSRMYQIVADTSRQALRVMRTRAEALDALGVADASFAPVE